MCLHLSIVVLVVNVFRLLFCCPPIESANAVRFRHGVALAVLSCQPAIGNQVDSVLSRDLCTVLQFRLIARL